MEYFDRLPIEMFYEIIRHVHDIKTYLNFISVINYKITSDNRNTFRSGLFIMRVGLQTTQNKITNWLTRIYLLPKDEQYVEIHIFESSFQNVHAEQIKYISNFLNSNDSKIYLENGMIKL